MTCEGRGFVGKEVSEDMFSAIDRVAEKLEKQVRRYKDKRTSERKSPANRTKKLNGAPRIGMLRVLSADSIGRGPHEHGVVATGGYPVETFNQRGDPR